MNIHSASARVGANPTAALRRVSLAVRNSLDTFSLDTQDAIILACSGGADSLALAITAADICQRSGVPCFSVTIDHGIRPESREEARNVAKMLGSFGVRSRAVYATVPASASGPEADARILRYRVLSAVGKELHSRGFRRVVVLLGHTLDDQAETVLLRLARGSGASSLRGMPFVREHDGMLVCRPLLAIRRADTVAACEQLSLPVVYDPTNELDGQWRTRSGEPLRRSAVRHMALPSLAQALGQDTRVALARTAALCADDDDALEFYAQQGFNQAVREAGKGELQVDVQVVAAVPVAVRRRVFRRACLLAGARAGALTEGHLNSVNALVEAWKGQGQLFLPGVNARRKGGTIFLRQAENS